MSESGEQVSQVRMGQMPQLDGLRAVCLLSIVVHHWTIRHLHLPIPFEVGAFVFFSLSGYLITRILLRGRSKLEQGDTTLPHLLKSFTMRRVLRLFPGYFCALLLYVLLLSPDVLKNFLWYVTNNTNLLFALQGSWSGGADQFWTLAVDQQFYALWPFLVLLIPRRFLPILFILVAAISPLCRYLSYFDLPLITGTMTDKLPWFLTDHLCIGSLLALLQERGRMPSRRVLWIGLIAALGVYLPMRYDWGGLFAGTKILIGQQTILAVFSTCLVGLCAGGFGGLGRFILEHPITQYVGKRSYGYYLYHNLAMLLLGKVAWFLYPVDGGADNLYPIRLLVGGYILYLMAHYSWKYLELPLINRKAKHRYVKATR